MNRYLNLFLVALTLFIASYASGQTNSVKLKGPGGSVISQHNSITTAYAAIPASLTQAYTIELDPAYAGTNEVYPITFVHKAGASAANTITITVADPDNVRAAPGDPNTSVFVFDNADWVIIDGRQVEYAGLTFSHRPTTPLPSVRFINGASNNTISGTVFYTSQGVDSTMAVLVGGTSSTLPNSNNIIEGCIFDSYNIAIQSQGNTVYPNENLVIRKNQMINNKNHGVKLLPGTGKVTIESNEITNWHDTNFSACIMAESFTDTAIISGNMVRLYRNGFYQKGAAYRGIYLESGGSGNYFLVSNNMIFCPSYEIPKDDTSGFSPDAQGDIAMIEFGGSNEIKADVYFNTAVVNNELSNMIMVPAGISSAAFIRSENNTNSAYNIKNNLFVNTRWGGGTGVQHAAIVLSSTNNVNIDYNTYEVSSGILARIGSNSYNTLSSYKAAFTGGNEAHADSMHLIFMSEFDMHLASRMYQQTRLYGTPVTGITSDIDNNLRTNTYRGADEYVISCGTIERGIVSGNPLKGCTGKTTRLDHYTQARMGGMDYQWQYRLAGTGAFIDIPDAKNTHLIVRFSDAKEYRIKDSCLAGGPAVYSDTVLIAAVVPDADSIVAIKLDATYKFYLAGAKNAEDIKWYVNWVHWVTNDTFTYTVQTPGRYTITAVIVNGDCTDTLTRDFDLTLSINDIANKASLAIYPNPAQDHLSIDITSPAAYTITDITGRVIQTGKTTGTIEIKNLLHGNYILNITNNKGTKQYGRFVKE